MVSNGFCSYFSGMWNCFSSYQIDKNKLEPDSVALQKILKAFLLSHYRTTPLAELFFSPLYASSGLLSWQLPLILIDRLTVHISFKQKFANSPSASNHKSVNLYLFWGSKSLTSSHCCGLCDESTNASSTFNMQPIAEIPSYNDWFCALNGHNFLNGHNLASFTQHLTAEHMSIQCSSISRYILNMIQSISVHISPSLFQWDLAVTRPQGNGSMACCRAPGFWPSTVQPTAKQVPKISLAVPLNSWQNRDLQIYLKRADQPCDRQHGQSFLREAFWSQQMLFWIVLELLFKA